MELVELWNCDVDKAYDLHMSFLKEENGFENPCFGMNIDEFKEYVKNSEKHSLGLDLPVGHVPDTICILIDDDNNYVGRFNIRHCLNDFLRNGPGHIGYGIRKEYRKKGYATSGLKLAIDRCKKLGIDEIYMSCNLDNEASLKTQLNSGAYIHHQDDKHYYTRIKI